MFGRNVQPQKRAYIWNLVSSIVYSLQSAVLLMVVTRVDGLKTAGIFSAIYAITHTMASLGSYSMRTFQVSDQREEFSFPTYFSSRVVTGSLMVIASLAYGFYQGVSIPDMPAVLLFSLYRAVECVEDVYHGEVEKHQRLDVASLIVAVRVIAATAVFSAVFALTRSLNLASFALVLTALLLAWVLNRTALKDFPEIHAGWDHRHVLRLLVVTFPIFIGAILYNYLVNMPKLTIFRVLNEETQALFNILFMPIFVINVLSQFIYRPLVAQMGEWWSRGERREMGKAVLLQSLLTAALAGAVALGAYLLGCPVLGFVYSVDLRGNELFLAVLMLFGGIAALDTFMSVVLTIMRLQNSIILAYVCGFVLCTATIEPMIRAWGMWGAGLAYGSTMTLILIVFIVTYGLGMRRARKEGLTERQKGKSACETS